MVPPWLSHRSLSEGREFWSLTLWRLGAAPSPLFAGRASALSSVHSARENPGGSEGAGNAAGKRDHEERPDPRGGQRRVARHLLIEKRERPRRLRARAAEVRRRLVRASAMSLLCVRGECAARRTRGSHASLPRHLCLCPGGASPELRVPCLPWGADRFVLTSKRSTSPPLLLDPPSAVDCYLSSWRRGDNVVWSALPDAINEKRRRRVGS